MKYVFGILLLGILWSCRQEKSKDNNLTEWKDETHKSFQNIHPGIAAYDSLQGVYDLGNEEELQVELKAPVVIAVADKEEPWGFFQFPTLYKTDGGDIIARWAMAADHAKSYGLDQAQYAQSTDEGKMWTLISEAPLGGGTELPNGDRIRNYTPKAIEIKKLRLPKMLASVKEAYGRTFGFYKHDELPDTLQGVYIQRLVKGQSSWTLEHNRLMDTDAVRYTDNDLFPVVWWGDMRLAKNGDVITGTYPGLRLVNGKVDASGISFYRSADQGRSWQVVGHIPYVYDAVNDPNGDKRLALGFTEPAFEILKDGSYLSVLRTSDGLGISPMYASRSEDEGKTWSRPQVITASGVLPKLLQLKNGVTVLSAGRPGVQLRFSLDPKGLRWTDPFEMLPFDLKGKEVSCGYTDLLPLGIVVSC